MARQGAQSSPAEARGARGGSRPRRPLPGLRRSVVHHRHRAGGRRRLPGAVMRHLRLFLEELRDGATDADVFQEFMQTVDAAEAWGIDGVWLGEIHFLPTRSILCSPLVSEGALGACTRTT